MDQIKIGKFIAEMRKEQNLTQIELAEQLGISNKTISKWECGNGMPDYAVMESLCNILKINVNELLSGERLPSQDYNKKAEENIMSLMQESSENYKREKKEMLLASLGIIALLFLVGFVMVMFGGAIAISYFIDVPTFTCTITIAILVVTVAGMLQDFGRAFRIAIKKDDLASKQQIHRSLLAIKTAIYGINIGGALSFTIGLVISLKEWSGIDNEPEALPIWIAVSFLGIVYGLVATLILIPVYMRLKAKLIED
ncbi:MAG: helix-turn-helix transcriptional regulator [Agathobacter sp.]|nr:helix-turn-helix transcriptional regulator [Agathobacter sp.]